MWYAKHFEERRMDSEKFSRGTWSGLISNLVQGVLFSKTACLTGGASILFC